MGERHSEERASVHGMAVTAVATLLLFGMPLAATMAGGPVAPARMLPAAIETTQAGSPTGTVAGRRPLPRPSTIARIAAYGSGIESVAVMDDGGEATGMTLFLPSCPAPSSFRLAGYSDDGRRIPLAVSEDPDGPSRLLLPTSAMPAHDLPASVIAGLSDTGRSVMWVRPGTDPKAEPVRLTVMQSARTQSMFVTTAQPRSYLERDKELETEGTLVAYDKDGRLVYSGGLDRVTGRGNSTWLAAKKPFNIKLDRKADLIGTGERHRSWCLMADAYDPTGLRNLVSLRLAKELGISETPDCEPCDLWWNGEYRGSYLITEKIGTWSGGIGTRDLGDEVEHLNMRSPETRAAYEEPVAVPDTHRGQALSYMRGLETPGRTQAGDLGGLVVEHDARYAGERCWFATSVGSFVLKSPSLAGRDLVTAAQDLFERAFACLYAGGGPDEYGCSASDYFDMDSLARCGWLYVVSGEMDYMFWSSSYFFVGDDGLIHAGPAWDFDLAWHNRGQTDADMVAYKGAFERNVIDTGNPDLREIIAEDVNPSLSALVTDIILGDEDAASADGRLRSIAWHWMDRERSRAMNAAVWGGQDEALERLLLGFSGRVAKYDGMVAEWVASEVEADAVPDDGIDDGGDYGIPDGYEDDDEWW